MLDVAIIGAGAAGLGAAKAAAVNGLSYKILEAASFVGGRARTDTALLGVPFDLGCRSLYGGGDNPFLAFAWETGSRLGSAPETVAFHDGTRFLDSKQTDAGKAAFERFAADLLSAHEKSLGMSTPHDRSQADIIDPSHPFARYFLQSLQVEHSAAAADVSVADPVHSLGDEGEEVLDGYGALILRAAGDVSVSLDCPVSAIDLSGRHVVLDTPKGRIDARTVVVTVSTAVLASERIALRPGGWPNAKLAAIEAVPMGSNTKVGFRLKPGALSPDLAEAHGAPHAGSTVYSLMSEPGNAHWLLGTGDGDLAIVYLGGAFSRDLALAGEEAQTDWAMQQLCGLLGSSIQQFVMSACATPFDREPWIDGGYSYCRYGAGNQRPALAEAIEDRVFFAGEACSLDHPATAHGAWLSGHAAIKQITSMRASA
jgi:monoamine oxidase